MKAANEVSKDVVETMKLLNEKGYDLSETYAFFDMGLFILHWNARKQRTGDGGISYGISSPREIKDGVWG